jgi:hypothetical protein
MALNNKGLICLKYDRLPEAISLFEQAIKHGPTLDAPKKNLEIAKARFSKQKEDKRT